MNRLRLLRHLFLAPALLALGLFILAGCEPEATEGTLVAQARQAYAEGRFSDAESLYEEYLQSTPQGKDRWEAWNRLLDVALNVRGDYETADALLEAMFLEFGEDPEPAWELLSRLAGIYESLGDGSMAVQTWQKALRIEGLESSHAGTVYLRLAKLYQEQRDYDLALEALKSCTQSASELETLAHCRYETAQTLGYMQNWHQAKEVLDGLLAEPEQDPEIQALAVFMLADIYEHEGDYAQAQELMESIRLTYPNPRVVETRIEHLKDLRDQ